MVINKTLRVHIQIIDETGQAIESKVIAEKEIIHPRTIVELGFNQAEQLGILNNIQQGLLDNQASFLNKQLDNSPEYTAPVRKNGDKK